MRVLIVLNENPLGSHPDVYVAFRQLATEGSISGFDVIPFAHLRAQGVADGEIVEIIKRKVVDGGHELVIWMHTGSLVVPDSALTAITHSPRRPKMAYWEGDAYQPWYKPIPKEMLRIMRVCECVYMVCGGSVIRSLRAAGVQRVHYAPHSASADRFPSVWSAKAEHEHAIVIVGNKVSSRIPFKTMPGARRREYLVSALVRRYGSRVAVYGSGWTGPHAMGPCAFDDQSRVYRSSIVTVGIENLLLPWYFSDRLPIALASGIPIVYQRNSGFEDIFPREMAGSWFNDEHGMFGLIDELLDADAPYLETVSRTGSDFFRESLSRLTVARFVVENTMDYQARRRPKHPIAWQRIAPLMESS